MGMPGAADRTVAVELLAKVSGYTQGMNSAAAATERTAVAMTSAAKAQTALERAQRQANVTAGATARAQAAQTASSKKQLAALTTLGRGFAVVGIAAGIGFGAAAKASIDFQREMANVSTLAKAGQTDTRKLAQAALTVGQAYGFTATQVAQAEAELVKAGVSVKDILGGALTGSLTLAAAGQTDLATATNIAAFAMTQFGKSGKDIPHIADLLSAGADKALGSVQDLGQGLTQVGLPAAQAGISIENTVGTLSALAQASQVGEKGGASLKQVLLQLQNPSKQAAALMDRYGISLFDANGNTKDFTALADNLQKSLSVLSPAQRQAALSTIFGSHAIQAATVLYQQGGKGISDWTKRVNDQGFAAGQASGKLNSLAGDLTKFHAALQRDLIETGDQASGALRGIVQAGTGLLDLFDHLGPGAKTFVVDMLGVVTVVGLAGGAALIVIPKYVAFRNALRELGRQAVVTATELDAEAAAATAAGRANATAAGGTGTASKLGKFGKAAGPIGALVTGLAIGKQAIDASVAGRVQSQTDALIDDPTKLAAARARQKQLADQLKQIQQGPVVAGKGGAGGVAGNVAALQGQYDTLTKEIKAATAATKDNAAANEAAAPALVATGASAGAAAVDIGKFTTAADRASHLFDVKAGLDQLAEGWLDLKKQVHDSSAAVTGNSKAALANRDALRAQYQVALGVINAYANQTDASGKLVHSASDVQREANRVADAFQRGADKAGIGKKKTDDYTAALKKVPPKVSTVITLDDALAQAKLAALRAGLSALDFHARQKDSGPTKINGWTGGTVTRGLIARYDTGGSVTGGRPGRDTVFARLDNGEEVIRKDRARKYRPLLKAINNAPGFAAGGTVGTSANLSDIFSLIATSGGTKKHPLTPFATQFARGVTQTARTDQAFISNLSRLAARGFGFLAMQLLEQGDHTAKVIASQAVRWSSGQLGTVQKKLQTSAKQQKQLGLLPAELAISSALRTGKNPTLASIAGATGIDVEDLQAGLIAMKSRLQGNSNARMLLSGLNSVATYQQGSWGSSTAQARVIQIVVEDKSGEPVRAGEQAALGLQRYATVSSGSW